MLSLCYTDAFQVPCKPSLNSSLSSSSSKDDGKGDDGNTDNELTEPSNEKMEEKEDFSRFKQGVTLSSISCFM